MALSPQKIQTNVRKYFCLFLGIQPTNMTWHTLECCNVGEEGEGMDIYNINWAVVQYHHHHFQSPKDIITKWHHETHMILPSEHLKSPDTTDKTGSSCQYSLTVIGQLILCWVLIGWYWCRWSLTRFNQHNHKLPSSAVTHLSNLFWTTTPVSFH